MGEIATPRLITISGELDITRMSTCKKQASERIQKQNETNWETNARLETGDGRDKQKRDKWGETQRGEAERSLSPTATATKLKQPNGFCGPPAVWSALCSISSQLTWIDTPTEDPPAELSGSQTSKSGAEGRKYTKRKYAGRVLESLLGESAQSSGDAVTIFSLSRRGWWISEELVSLCLIRGYLGFTYQLALTTLRPEVP